MAEYAKKIFCDKPNAPKVDWVLFTNGTILSVLREESQSKDELISKCKSILNRDGPVFVGSPAADFTVHTMDLLFEEPVHVVSYNCEEEGAFFGTIVTDLDENAQEVFIGLTGRKRREMDTNHPAVIATSKD